MDNDGFYGRRSGKTKIRDDMMDALGYMNTINTVPKLYLDTKAMDSWRERFINGNWNTNTNGGNINIITAEQAKTIGKLRNYKDASYTAKSIMDRVSKSSSKNEVDELVANHMADPLGDFFESFGYTVKNEEVLGTVDGIEVKETRLTISW